MKESLWPPPLQPRQHLRFSGRGGRDIFLSVIAATPGLRHDRESIVVESPGNNPWWPVRLSTCFRIDVSREEWLELCQSCSFLRYWFKKACYFQCFTEMIYLRNSQYFLRKFLRHMNVLILECKTNEIFDILKKIFLN